MTDRIPLFDFGDTLDSTVYVGRVVRDGVTINEGTPLPIHVKRFTKTEFESFEKQWVEFLEPRGTAELSPEAAKEREVKQVAFVEITIRECITIDEGLIRDRGTWVTDGAGLISLFHNRVDVLSAFLFAVAAEQRLSTALAKNWNSPRVSGTGLVASPVTRGGDAPESIVAPVAPLTIAPSVAVTDESRTAEPEAPASSGVRAEPIAVG